MVYPVLLIITFGWLTALRLSRRIVGGASHREQFLP